MARGDYGHYRRLYEDVSTTLRFSAAATTATLIAAKTNHTIFVQRIIVWITTSTTATETFEDGTTGNDVARIPASPGADTRWDFDFGPSGTPLAVSESLVQTLSAAGHAGHLVVEAYRKQTSGLSA